MLTGLPLLFLITLILVFIIVACTVFRWHPFLVLIVAAITLGITAGMAPEQVITTLLNGGGAVFASIGIIIALGTILGEILEKTGAVTAIANSLLQKAGSKRVLPGMSLLGGFIGIPIFCDSGFVILSSLAHSLSQKSTVSYGAVSIALATGLYTTHVLVPPTPGPLAAAGNLNMSNDLGWVILLGLLVSIPSIMIGWWFARRYQQTQTVAPDESELQPTVHPLLPGFLPSILPLLLPVILIAFGSMISFFKFPPRLSSALLFICNPNIALLLGSFCAFILLGFSKKKEWNDWIQNALVQAGPIILITAAGGALGAILKATPLAEEFKTWIAGKELAGLLFFPVAYLLAAGLKTAQGSSTASLIITSSILASLVGGMGLDHPAQKALLVLCIGAGAMTVSHANDSYFWVINQYSKIPVGKMYRYFTTATFFMGLSILISCMLLSLLF